MSILRFLRLGLVCSLPVLPAAGLAQSLTGNPPVHFEHYTMAEGLSSMQVRKIVQDRYGFIWIGTTDGLNRFDGRQFTVYRHLTEDSNSLSNNIINSLSVDSAGRVWIATNNGLCYYDPSDDRFHSVDISRNNGEPFDRYRVHQVFSGTKGRIWYCTRTELHLLEPGGKVRTFALPPAVRADVVGLFVDQLHEGRIWIGTNKSQLLLFDSRDSSFTAIPIPFHTPNSVRKIPVAVGQISQLSEDSFLVGTWYGGMQEVVVSGHNARVTGCPDEEEIGDRKWIVQGICPSSTRQQVWVATYGDGLAWFDPVRRRFTGHAHHADADRKSLCSDLVNVIFMDKAGTLWVGTDEGLDKYDTLSNRFSVLNLPSQHGQYFSGQHVVDLIADGNDSAHRTLWIAVQGRGLLSYRVDQGWKGAYPRVRAADPFSISSSINCLFQDNTGLLWIGARDGVFTFGGGRSLNQIKGDSGQYPRSVSAIVEDYDRRLVWVATFNNGLYCYDLNTKQWTAYRHDPANPSSLPDDHVFCLLQDSRKRIWVGTQNQGLCLLDQHTGRWKAFRQEENNRTALPDNNVYALLEDRPGRLWIATENGLAVMNLADERIRTYTTADGLCNNDIFSMARSPEGHLWLATNNGLSDLDPVSGTFRNYYSSDGLPANSLNEAFRCLPDGTLMLGMAGGIVYFKTSSLKMNKRIPPVIITAFKIFDKEVPVRRSGEAIEALNLTYAQNMITFNFAALNFTHAVNNSYAYRLEGFDKDWIYAGQRTSATYTNLDGGGYTFRVKAANNDGIWNEKGASMQLYIRPPFRKTAWFYILLAVSMGAAFYTLYRIRLMQVLQLQRIRTDIARDLHDDIGSTLSSISMMSRMAAEDRLASGDRPAEVLGTIARASQQAMELMGEIIWSINPANDKMENILIRMREYAGETLEAADIRLVFEAGGVEDHLQWPLKKRRHFLLIFKEAVNNLAKYSHATRALIRITGREHALHLLVEDNGVGLTPNRRAGGNGLKNMRERAAALGGEFSISAGPEGGTVIRVSIPFIP
ncbi:MAG: two-component regulator propeller domain-containing protein [Bacteroidota bacterium]|nr:two-component regulator propeller domain-containing protein [Bacteroidota bacterium]